MRYSHSFFLPLLVLSLTKFKLKDGVDGGWRVGRGMEEGENEKKGVNCLPIDNSIITL